MRVPGPPVDAKMCCAMVGQGPIKDFDDIPNRSKVSAHSAGSKSRNRMPSAWTAEPPKKAKTVKEQVDLETHHPSPQETKPHVASGNRSAAEGKQLLIEQITSKHKLSGWVLGRGASFPLKILRTEKKHFNR